MNTITNKQLYYLSFYIYLMIIINYYFIIIIKLHLLLALERKSSKVSPGIGNSKK